MNTITKTVLTLVIVGALVTAVAFKLTSNKEELSEKIYQPDVNTAVMVQVDSVKMARFDQSVTFTGSFAPNREVTLGAETTGKVIKVNIQEGSRVAAGSVIAQLDSDLLKAQLQSAQASYDRAINTLTRYQQAVSGVTQLQIDNAKTDVLTAKAQIDQLKKQINQHSIHAPFGGVITTRNFDLGAIVSPGMLMATLIDISSLKLEINVPEKNIAQFKTGQIIEVTSDVYPGTKFKGTVEMIGSNADASHNFMVKVRVANSNAALRSGMYGTVALTNTLSADALTVPRSAIIGSSAKPQVYVIENNVAKIRDIHMGSGNENRVQITNGLAAGDLVVSGGLVNLNNGSRVSIAK